MRPGDVLETAMWLDGRETEEQMAMHRKVCQQAIARGQEEEGVVIGPIKWVEKYPGDDRVPEVPKGIQGPNVRLLVAEAKVVCMAPHVPLPGSFLLDLDKKDLARLREATRRVWRKDNPHAPDLSDSECDQIIEECGPRAALEQVKHMVDHGQVN